MNNTINIGTDNNREIIETEEYFDNSEQDDKTEDEYEESSDETFQWDTFNYSIRGSVSNTDVESIINSLGDGTIKVPGFQRKFVWGREKVSELAFSIIKGIPVPPIYIYFDQEDGSEFVLDGQQRVTALFLYYYGLYFQNENIKKKIDFVDISAKMKQKAKIEEALEENKTREQQKILLDQRKAILEDLKELYGLTETDYCVKDYSGKTHDITFDHYQEKEKRFLKRKSIQFAVVECAAGDSPQKFYTMVFKMLNSGGKNIGQQEIRNGLYWKTTLFKGLFKINEDSLPWRAIYGKMSLYSKDVELLLKMMALNRYTILNNEKGTIDIDYYRTFNWGNIMSSYSQEAAKWKDEVVEVELKKMRFFLDNIVLDAPSRKCRKATLEAVYVCMNKLGLLEDTDNDKLKINMSWLVELSQDVNIFGDGKVLSNKDSVQARLSNTLLRVKKIYGEN